MLKSKYQNEQFSTPNKKKVEEEEEKSSLEQLITDPLHLKLLILAGTDLKIKELHEINACVNLMKLDISSNNLQTLPANVDFANFVNLRLLYLHNNNLSDMDSLNQIFKCKQVTYLTLFRNPLSELNSIRHYIINSMPSLKCFDFNYVIDEERTDILLANDTHCAKYYSLSKLSWPIVIYPNDESLTEQQYLNILFSEISVITTQHRKCSFIITLQRFVRGFIVRRRVHKLLLKVQQKENSIVKYAAKWKQYTQRKKQLKELLVNRKKQYLLEDSKMYRHARAMNILAQLVRDFNVKLQQKKRKERAARILLRNMNSKKAYFHSYNEYLKLQSNSHGFSPQIQLYFRADQLSMIDNEQFKQFMVLFASDSAIFKPQVEEFCLNLSSNITKSSPFQIFRIPESDDLVLTGNPLIQLIKPGLNCKVVQRRKNYEDRNQSQKYQSQNEKQQKQNQLCNEDNQQINHDKQNYQDKQNENDKYYEIKKHPILMKYQRIVHIKEKCLAKRYKMNEQERAKSNQLINKIKIFQDTNDSTLYELKFPNDRIISYFLRTVVYMNQDVDSYIQDFKNSSNNMKNSEDENEIKIEIIRKKQKKQKILIFFSIQLERISSAVKIQQVWRYYAIKKRNSSPYKKLLIHHAASKIQKWIKKLAYIHKTNFTKDIYHHLTNVIKTKQLLIHEQVYLNLLNYSSNKLYHPFQSGKNALFSFHQQNAVIYFSKKNDQVIAKNLESQFIPSVFPSYVKNIFTDLPLDSQFDASYIQGDIFHVLHVGCKITRHEIGPMNYIQIDFPSLSQAIYRTAILGKHSN